MCGTIVALHEKRMNLSKIPFERSPQNRPGLRAPPARCGVVPGVLLFSFAMESRQVLYGTDCLFEGVLLVVS